MRKWVVLTLVLSAMAVGAIQVSAQIKKGKTRAALTKQIMSGLVQPHCAAIGAVAKQAPADDKAWATLATNAALLNEASYLLMDDGRCPDAEWAAASTALRTASAAVMAKIESKDVAGISAEFKNVTAACAACHKVHKK